MSDIYVTKDEYNELLSQFTKLQKQMKKVLKTIKKEGIDESKPKKLSGFAKPTQISEELALFLNIDKDELIARTQVTKLINKYVKENDLQNPENKREIVMNDVLKKLVDVPDDVTLSFFNLQKYIKHHYPENKTVIEVKLDSPIEEKEVKLESPVEEKESKLDSPLKEKEVQAPIKKTIRKKVLKR